MRPNMRNSIQVAIIWGVIVANIFVLPAQVFCAERYTPLAREYIERARANLKREKEEAPAAQKVVKEERLKPRQEVEIELEEVPLSEQISSLVEYYLAVGDKLEVAVWGHNDLSKDILVGPDGRISYPLVGRISASGLTIGQLERKIEKALSAYIKYPHVSVMLKSFEGNKIIILGQIKAPGIYKYTSEMNLIEAIAGAGDFTEGAQQDSVIVVRGNLTENPQVMRINMSQVIKRGTSNTDIVLKPNDVIYVPRSFIGNLNRFLTTISPTISQATGMLGIKEYRNIHNLATAGEEEE